MASPDLFCAHCGAANAAMATTCFACGSSLSQDDPLLIPTGITAHTATVSSAPTITGQLAHDYLLKGRYRILKQIGTGGFGAVYQAQDLRRNDALVAIKSINLHRLSPEQIIEATDTFNREVGMLSELEHPHLPHIYEHFTDPEHWYLVMDFIEGETLEHYLSQAPEGRLALSEVLDMGMQLCTVLDYLHSQQPPIIFRDVKPGNIMRTSSGHLYLIDFGIARHFTPGQARDTMPLGSPGYAPPEQYGKAQTTVQSDIYSLGATLQTLLTGKDPLEPFFGSTSPYTEEQGAPAELASLLAQMLERDVDKRPASIAIVKQRLLQIKRDQQQQAAHFSAYARSSPPPHTPTSASSSSRPAAKQKMLFWSPLSSTPLRVLTALIVISIIFLSVAFHTGGGFGTQLPSSSFRGVPQLPSNFLGSGPREIIAGLDGAFWFTEQDGNKIGRMTTQGAITEFTITTNSSAFSVSEITAGPDGAIWFLEDGIVEEIGRMTTQGAITQFAFPQDNSAVSVGGITAGPDGALWFTEYAGNKIGRITTQGSITQFALPTNDSFPRLIVAGPDRALWFTVGNNKIGRITTQGSITQFALPTNDIASITAGPDGALWFCEPESDKIGRITTKGSITQFALPTTDSYPNQITAGPDGALWFVEAGVEKIGRITTQGSITQFTIPPTSDSGPLGITAGPDGALWFIEYGEIGRITTKGSITEFTAPS